MEYVTAIITELGVFRPPLDFNQIRQKLKI
jgi:translation initiation factor 2B subunit (eIF-2B alpha/beta/delta family)